MVVAMESIEIGDDTRTGERVSVRDHDHRFDQPGMKIKDQGYVVAGIKIGRDCWLGCNSVVLKGVSIGDGSIIGAGAVVTKSIPPNSIALGVPAKVVRSRTGSDTKAMRQADK